MGCGGDRDKGPPERKQRWDFIELNDFQCHSPWTYFGYAWLWFMALVGIIVYVIDTYTAINLLVFDRWSSQVQPAIPFRYSKWIFSACIFLSWALLAYEWFRAYRVIRRDGVAASYMDPLAMSLQSMRSRGWRRFLVYTALTKSKKGTDYVAFFVYFAFQGAIRVILAEGPRQFVKGVTLYAVMQAQIIDAGKPTDGHSNIEQFFLNIQAIADDNYQQAIIYASMLFTFVIWVFSALCLIAAGILYIVFLWHYIPQRDGRLRIYCRRKIDRRLEKIVAEKYGVGEAEEARKRAREEKKAELRRLRTGEVPIQGIKRAAALPDLGDNSELKKAPSLTRTETKSTVSTLPLYTSRPPTQQAMDRQPSLPDLDRPAMPSRTATAASAWSKASFESNAPLLPHAAFADDEDRLPSPAPTYFSRNQSFSSSNHSVPRRMNTQSTQASQRSFTPLSRVDTSSSQQRSYTPVSATSSRPPPNQRFPVRSNTSLSNYDEPYSAVSESSPIDSFCRPPMPPPPRQNTAPPQRQNSDMSYLSRSGATTAPPIDRRPTYDSVNPPLRGPTPTSTRQPSHGSQPSFARSFTPAYAMDQPTPPPNSYEMTSNPPPISQPVYRPFNPAQHGSTATPILTGPRRNITLGGPVDEERGDYFSLPQAGHRSVTAPVVEGNTDSIYGSILDDYCVSTPNEIQPPQGYYPPRGPSRTGDPGWRSRY